MLLLFSALLALALFGCAATQLSGAKIEALREHYPMVTTRSLYGGPAEFGVSIHGVSHLAIIEVIEEDIPPGLVGWNTWHYRIRIEKILWQNVLPYDEEGNQLPKSYHWPDTPIEEGKEYITGDRGNSVKPDDILQPGRTFVAPIGWWGSSDGAMFGCIRIDWDFLYYLTQDGYILSVSIEEQAKAYTGWTAQAFAEDLTMRMDTFYEEVLERMQATPTPKIPYDPANPPATPKPSRPAYTTGFSSP